MTKTEVYCLDRTKSSFNVIFEVYCNLNVYMVVINCFVSCYVICVYVFHRRAPKYNSIQITDRATLLRNSINK